MTWGIVWALTVATQPHPTDHEWAMLMRHSYYEFRSDGKPLFWCTDIKDGKPTNIVFNENDAITIADPVSAFRYSGKWVVTSPHFAHRSKKMNLSIGALPSTDRPLKEKEAIEYFLQTHNPLDEGYQYLSDYRDHIDSLLTPIIRLKYAISSPGKKSFVEKTKFYLTRSGERGVRSEATLGNEAHETAPQIISHSSLPTPHSSLNSHSSLIKPLTSLEQTYIGPRDNDGRPHGTGFTINLQPSGDYKLSFGEWDHGQFRGERLYFTSDRIYGIDISRWQHDYGGEHKPIDWASLRITNIGERSRLIGGEVDLPVSFVYIKATEATSIVNRHYSTDYQDAHTFGYHVGTYHFFSLSTDGEEQAIHFLQHLLYLPGDFPPVLDIEPSDQQVAAAGGEEQMFRNARKWLNYVEEALGVTPIIYANQHFVKRYLSRQPDLRDHYPVWIARYSEFMPDFKLVFWQLSPEGRVRGITGYVDINVFNGYQAEFEKFTKQ